MNDERLIQKVQSWMEWIVTSGREDGWFGPARNRDRWPLSLGLKVLAQYYEASHDDRALKIIQNYFRYLKDHPPDWPQKDWRGVRAMENAVTGYWLYRRTGDEDVLGVIASIHNNSYSWTDYFTRFPWTHEALMNHAIPYNWDSEGLTAHAVNIAMAVKYPGLWYLQSGDPADRQAGFKGLENLDRYHGQAAGRFSGDEHLSGTRPGQGTELCAVVELMFSLENLVAVLGDAPLADRLELLAYNANPGACTADYWAHQYDQQSNQVLCSAAKRPWSTNGDHSNLFGLEPNFGCCTANMHQGWPKFVSHLWMATPDKGLAAAAYGPSQVKAKVGAGVDVTIVEKTNYPFEGYIEFEIQPEKPVTFPLTLRIPEWAKGASIFFGDTILKPDAGQYVAVERLWRAGDRVKVDLPMKIRLEKRYNQAVAVHRGPVIYSLKIAGERKTIKTYHDTLPVADYEFHPTAPWNYALVVDPQNPEAYFKSEIKGISSTPYATDHPPVEIQAKGILVPDWQMEQNSAADPPSSPLALKGEAVDLTLVPYASTPLRITEFPYTQDK